VNQVPGCASTVWVYPVPTSNSESLKFFADSNSGVTKGIIALILMVVQGKSASEVLNLDVERELEPLGLQKHFSSLRTSGLKNMIAQIRQTAERLAPA
jgi:cysteine desulfuration protein SufE